jgi:hypothetical protein
MADQEVPLTSFPLDQEITVNFDAADITANLNRLQVVQLIKELDESKGDWAITCALALHFNAELERYRTDVVKGSPASAGILGMSAEELTVHLAERDTRDALRLESAVTP